MNKQVFLERLKEELEIESEISLTTNIKELEEWDSMAAMLLIGLVSNEFNVTLTGDDIQNLTDFNALITLIGVEKFA